MSSRKELADTLRELIRQISSSDPANRRLALIEQLMNAMISDFTALTIAVADLVQDSNSKNEQLQQQIQILQQEHVKSAMLRRTDLPLSEPHDNESTTS